MFRQFVCVVMWEILFYQSYKFYRAIVGRGFNSNCLQRDLSNHFLQLYQSEALKILKMTIKRMKGKLGGGSRKWNVQFYFQPPTLYFAPLLLVVKLQCWSVICLEEVKSEFPGKRPLLEGKENKTEANINNDARRSIESCEFFQNWPKLPIRPFLVFFRVVQKVVISIIKW